MSDCIFCKIVAGEIPADVVWQDGNAMAFRDIRPQAPVHVVIVPRRHCVNFNDLADDPFMASLAVGIREVARDAGVAESGYRVMVNNGPDGHQEVFHLHVHVLGGRPLGPMLLRPKAER